MSGLRRYFAPFIIIITCLICSFISETSNVYGQIQIIKKPSGEIAVIHNQQVIDNTGSSINGISKQVTEANSDTEITSNAKELVSEKEHEKERDIMEEALELLDESLANRAFHQ